MPDPCFVGPSSAVLTLDLGTSSCKGALYSLNGARLALASHDYPLDRPAPQFVEQHPQDYLDAARHVCRELSREAHRQGVSIACLGFSTQTPTLVFCNAGGEALGPAILWQDARADGQARSLNQIDEAKRRDWFGMDLPIGAASTPSKLLWMKANAPDLWRETRWVVQPKDFVAAHLTGRFATDRWCAKGLAHLQSGQVHPEFLRLLGKEIPPSPPALSPHAILGTVAPHLAPDWGLPLATPVSVGWSDALAGILATGALHHSRRGFVLAGTSEIVGLSRSPASPAPGLYRVPPDLLDLHGLELHFGPTQAGGACLDWLAALLEKTPEQTLDLLDPAPATPLSPILFRPYLHGERAPYWDHQLSASFEGLRTEHHAPDLVHAVLQGVALQERLVLECAERELKAREVVLAGGAARHPRWNQLRADILQRPVLLLSDPEASLRGAALLAWAALRSFDLRHPPEEWFSADQILPNPACQSLAAQLLDRFRLPRTAFDLSG